MSDTQNPIVSSPEAGSKSRISPIVAIAAVSVIIFSAVGVGVMTGVIPSSISKSSDQQQAAPAPQPQAQEPAAKPAPKPARSTASAPKKPAAERTQVAAVEPPKTATAPVCSNCGSVIAVNAVEQQGEGTGIGAVAGGVAGALLGNQIGSGSGRKLATVAGAAGGAYAGHQIEKHVKTTKRYDVVVRMQDGSSRTFPYEKEPGFNVGDKVKVVEGALVAN